MKIIQDGWRFFGGNRKEGGWIKNKGCCSQQAALNTLESRLSIMFTAADIVASAAASDFIKV